MSAAIPGRLGIICSPEDFLRSQTDLSIRCLTRGESIGLTIVSEAGLVSLIAVSYVYAIILRNIAWRMRHLHSDKLRVFHHPMDLLMFSLFTADLLQGIGAVLDIKWVHDGKVEVGQFCDAQGIIQQLGETGVAITTLVIAVYTFLGIWIGRNIRSVRKTAYLMAGAWSFIILMVILGNALNRGNSKAPYQSPTPYWCWIGQGYLQWRIWGEYIWFWITLSVSFIIYIPLYLWSRGNISIDDNIWWKFRLQKVDANADPALKGVRHRALVMLAYPLVYCVSILPLSIVRWISFVNEESVTGTATLVVISIYGLSGACNAILLLTTRPESELFSKPTQFSAGRAPSPLGDYLIQSNTEHPEPNELELELGRLPSRQ